MTDSDMTNGVAVLSAKLDGIAQVVENTAAATSEVRDNTASNVVEIALLKKGMTTHDEYARRMEKVVLTGNGKQSLVAQAEDLRKDHTNLRELLGELAELFASHEKSREADRRAQDARRKEEDDRDRTARRSVVLMVVAWVLTTATTIGVAVFT